MKFFLDTANIEEIKTAKKWGLLSGLTTNPSIIAKTNTEFREIASELCELVNPFPVSLEVVARDTGGMVAQARILNQLADNVVIKLPTNPAGMAALTILKEEGIKTNLTLIFSASQAVLAASAGATYVSPFIGRLEDRGYDGLGMTRDLMSIFKNYNFDTEIIAASIRDPHQALDVCKAGAHIITMPFAVLEKMLLNTMTDTDLDRFLNDWEKVPGKENAFTERVG